MRMLYAGWMLATVTSITVLGSQPPKGSKPLSELLETLGAGGLNDVTEVSLDDGVWEIEGMRDNKPVELRVDPLTGNVINERADEVHPRLSDGAKPLGETRKLLEASGYASVTEAELETGSWEIEAWRAGSPRDLVVDVRTGKVISDQPNR